MKRLKAKFIMVSIYILVKKTHTKGTNFPINIHNF